MSTMVMARFESVPMARSAAYALIADGFSEEIVGMFYGRQPVRERGLWAWLAGAVRTPPSQPNGEILLVVMLSLADVPFVVNFLRDAGSVSVEQSRDDWQDVPWDRTASSPWLPATDARHS